MYTIGREHAKQAMLLGSLSDFWCGPAFSNPAMELWRTLRYLASLSYNQAVPLCPSSGDRSVCASTLGR